VLAAASMVGLHIWRQPTGGKRSAENLLLGGTASQVAFLGSGSELLFNPRWPVQVNLDTLESIKFPLWRDVGCVFGITRDGRQLILGQNVSAGARLQCREVREGALGDVVWLVELSRWLELRNHPRFVNDGRHFVLLEVTYNPVTQERRFALATRETATGDMVGELELGPERILQLTSLPCGGLIAGYRNTRLLVWDVAQNAKQVAELRTGNKKEFTSLAFHPSGRFLAATSNDETVKLYDTQTWELAKTFTWDIGRMRSIAFSPDGTLAAAGSDTGKVVVWDVDV
jgi:WD40 repeat protein